MKSIYLFAISYALTFATMHAVEVGQGAPYFAAQNLKGQNVSLGELRGKMIVLEWVDFGCPFSAKHYASGNMQKLQEKYKALGVVWITVESTVRGRATFLEPAKLASLAAEKGNKASHFIQDEQGKLGQVFKAVKSPQMIIISKDGSITYNGAIDSIASSEEKDIAKAEPLFANALDALLAGKPAEKSQNAPYGCTLKY
jgi:peroxiredoxin